ncbi:DJ-1/PfpI family protein [Sphingomonas sp. ID1715]|uniref:DJ-1/PfpI family protein n=1 Tax=Sphingomonas sp. ID1715 TaxID=1656898 RepID=UPI0014890189|nr:DJ-1/PfpI family protein [Sphingomonas sp. ID1715]NNM77037.1 DJ-1/PfpI family protein [Sphingomonas sp. ID1715]
MQISFLLFPHVTQLDLTGPAQVLSRLPNAKVELVAKTLEPVPTDAGFPLLPSATFDSAAVPDILCVPGGFGVTGAMEDEATLAWLRRATAQAQWVTSVCTGALVLGAAGLLQGYRATTHWASHDWLAAFGAIPVKERIVFDGNRVTGGGVTAGIDFGLALAAEIAGDDHARFIQLSLEYDPAPPFDAGSPDKASAATIDTYNKLVARLSSDRPARYQAAAHRLHAKSPAGEGGA